jgi:hypothetical protein
MRCTGIRRAARDRHSRRKVPEEFPVFERRGSGSHNQAFAIFPIRRRVKPGGGTGGISGVDLFFTHHFLHAPFFLLRLHFGRYVRICGLHLPSDRRSA